MNPNRKTSRAQGFTLIELMAAMVVIGVLGVVTSEIIAQAARGYSLAAESRTAHEQLALALDRLGRVVTRAPGGSAPGSPGISATTTTSLTLTDGSRVLLSGGTLVLDTPEDSGLILLSGVTAFELVYLDHAGVALVTVAADTPSRTRRIAVRLAAGGAELRTILTPRTGLPWRLR